VYVCKFDESKQCGGNAATLQGSVFQRAACSTKQACCFREEDPINREILAIKMAFSITDRLKQSSIFQNRTEIAAAAIEG
jgi:hypothetical protein